jgi:hypothetical protein
MMPPKRYSFLGRPRGRMEDSRSQTQTGAAHGRERTAVLRFFDTLSGNPFLDYPQLGSLRGVASLGKNLAKEMWFCSAAECVMKRNRPGTSGQTKVVQAPPPPWRAAAQDTFIPDASNLREQFWSQSFREAIRQNSKIEERPRSLVGGVSGSCQYFARKR